MQKQGEIHFEQGPKWSLIECPIPNSPEGKYISQIPSPNNLLTAASAIKSIGETDIKLYNFLKTRRPPVILSPNIIYNLGEATCMDFLYNYAYDYLNLLRIHNPISRIITIGYHAWLHEKEFADLGQNSFIKSKKFETTSAHYFEDDIIGAEHEKVEWHNAWEINDWEFMKENVASKTKGIRTTFRASRGCPHKCKMCPVLQTYGSKVRRYSVDWVMEEINTLYTDYGIRQIGFLDDNLFFNKKWANELLDRIINGNFKGLSLTFEEGLDVPTALDEELVIKMKKAHFTHMKLGVESFNAKTLDFIQKPYRDPQMAIDAIKLLQKHGLSPVCFICIGFPTDTEESIKETIKILMDLKVKLRVQILWAYPGITFQGQALSAETLKQLQRDAMYGTNSVAWPKKCKDKIT